MSLDDRNAALNQRIKETDLPSAVAVLINDAKRRKLQVRWLAISILLDVLLTFAFGFVSVKTHQIATAADSNHQAIVRNCETSNEARANNKQIWGFLLAVQTPQVPTLQQAQTRQQFQQLVDKTFAPRDCTQIK